MVRRVGIGFGRRPEWCEGETLNNNDEHLSITSLDTTGPYGNYSRFEEMWRALVHGLDLKAERFCPRKGEGLIWSANLLHGGDRQNDPTLTSTVVEVVVRDLTPPAVLDTSEIQVVGGGRRNIRKENQVSCVSNPGGSDCQSP